MPAVLVELLSPHAAAVTAAAANTVVAIKRRMVSSLWFDEMEFRLALERPADSAGGIDDGVLFLRGVDGLAVPLGHLGRRLQLDREPHVRDHLRVAAAGHTVLVILKPDERTGAVAVHADRMGVDRSVDTQRRRFCQIGR